MTIQLDAAQLAEAVRRYKSGEAVRPIAKDYGVSKHVLQQNLRRAGVTIRPKSCALADKSRRKQLSVTEFVEAWLAHPTIAAIAAGTGMTEGAIYARGRAYRAKGVHLPPRRFSAGDANGMRIRPESVDAINALIVAAEKNGESVSGPTQENGYIGEANEAGRNE